ncbi:MAG: galactose mutarotase [Clostridiales bacterium]|nr:galactose mutarotase [Clostridiales bacterium]
MSISVKPFGVTPDGREAKLYTMTNASGASVEITDFGGIIRAINVPDRDGKLASVVLGYPSVEGYSPVTGYIGALIGRVGNRIANGKCTVSGQELTLAKNEGGKTHLHGGDIGFDRKMWEVTPLEGICNDKLILKYTSPDGEEGYPGTLRVMVTYTFTDDNEFVIQYEAVSDKDTLCNLTNHSYFNLSGEGSGSIEDHYIRLNCDTFTVVDADCIPTGEQRDVTGTPFDLRKFTRIGDGLKATDTDEQMSFGKGYDHNFNINDDEFGLNVAAEVRDLKSGRSMTVFTDMPAVQFYCANMLNGVNPGSCGRPYTPREGFCLETQFAPDSINHPEFPDSVLYAGEKYDYTTIFSFDIDDSLED